jgi:hypothetical protein
MRTTEGKWPSNIFLDNETDLRLTTGAKIADKPLILTIFSFMLFPCKFRIEI